MIKPMNEIIRDKLNECTDTLTDPLLKSVRPIYGSSMQGTPVHIGSCVLIELDGTKYLLTAAHVVDNNDITSLYVGGEPDLVLFEGAGICTPKIEDSRKKDRFDFAAFRLTEPIINKLGAVVYLDENQLYTRDSVSNGNCFLALGYPNSKNKKFDNQTKKVSRNPFVYSSTLKNESTIFTSVGVQPTTHHLLDFDHNQSKDENGNIVNSIAPIGASGGGLFYMGNFSNPDFLRPSSKCLGLLSGILIENIKSQKVIVAVRISLIIDEIKKKSSQALFDAKLNPVDNVGNANRN